MELQEIMQVISNVGFPIAACIYMMISSNKKTEKLSEAVISNTKAVENLTELVKALHGNGAV